jgi:hypothetical protein
MKGDNCSRIPCDKKAIGYESNRHSYGLNFCEDHASRRLLEMKPGTKEEGNNYYRCKY